MIPPWLSYWVTEHWFFTTIILLFVISSVYGIIRGAIVNFLKIFHKQQVNVVVKVDSSNATPESIGEVVRHQISEHLGSQRPTRRQTRLQSLDDDDED